MAALIIAIFPQNSSRGNWEEQQDRTDPNSRFELARKPAWLLAFRQFGLPKWKHDFESLKLLDEAGPARPSLAAEGIFVTSKKARHTAICRQKSAAFCEMTLEKAFFTQAVSGCISGVVVLDVR